MFSNHGGTQKDHSSQRIRTSTSPPSNTTPTAAMPIVPNAVASVIARVRRSSQSRESSRSRANSSSSTPDVGSNTPDVASLNQATKGVEDARQDAPAAETATEDDVSEHPTTSRSNLANIPVDVEQPGEQPQEEPTGGPAAINNRTTIQVDQTGIVYSDVDDDVADEVLERFKPGHLGLESLSTAEREDLQRPRALRMLTPIRELSNTSALERSTSDAASTPGNTMYTASEVQAPHEPVRSVSRREEEISYFTVSSCPPVHEDLITPPATENVSQIIARHSIPTLPAILEPGNAASSNMTQDEAVEASEPAHIVAPRCRLGPSRAVPSTPEIPHPTVDIRLPLTPEPSRTPSPLRGTRTFQLALQAAHSNPKPSETTAVRRDSDLSRSSSPLGDYPETLKFPPVTVADASSDSASLEFSGAPPLPSYGPILEFVGAPVISTTSTPNRAPERGPPHTAERPNWALAPDEPKSQAQPRQRGRAKGGNDSRRGRQRSHSRERGGDSTYSVPNSDVIYSSARANARPPEARIKTPKLSAVAQAPHVSLMGPLSVCPSDPKAALRLENILPTPFPNDLNGSSEHVRLSDLAARYSPAPTSRSGISSASTDSRLSPIDPSAPVASRREKCSVDAKCNGVVQASHEMEVSFCLSYKLPSGEACFADVRRAVQVHSYDPVAITIPLPVGSVISGPVVLQIAKTGGSRTALESNFPISVGHTEHHMSGKGIQKQLDASVPTVATQPSTSYDTSHSTVGDEQSTLDRLISQDTVDPGLLPCSDRSWAMMVASNMWPRMQPAIRLRVLRDGLHMRAAYALKFGWQGSRFADEKERSTFEAALRDGYGAETKSSTISGPGDVNGHDLNLQAHAQVLSAAGNHKLDSFLLRRMSENRGGPARHSLGHSNKVLAARAGVHDSMESLVAVPRSPSASAGPAMQCSGLWDLSQQPSLVSSLGHDFSVQEMLALNGGKDGPRFPLPSDVRGVSYPIASRSAGGRGYSAIPGQMFDHGSMVSGANSIEPPVIPIIPMQYEDPRHASKMFSSEERPRDRYSLPAYGQSHMQQARNLEQRAQKTSGWSLCN
ncbi:hypothetical protein OBBRIDRAFT_166377 [Obba rivulosa]|uniref:Uncharacterized protein n=1 Tax=Obba rivulosa TaxID=1052685 RepID=A0A8E2J4C5_9APHY|nr:hypothetical protein OBBRIDRAFT_166377 [Obba rivulosa]